MGGYSNHQPKIPPPAPAPDLADEAVRKARMNEMNRQLSTGGRKSTFMSGLLGDAAPAPSTPKKLLGS